MAAGADAVTATKRAYAALFGMVQRQAAMVSFVGLFQLLGHPVPRAAAAGAADEAAAQAAAPARGGALSAGSGLGLSLTLSSLMPASLSALDAAAERRSRA